MRGDFKFLRENLSGPILQIEDPAEFSTEDILASYLRYIIVLAKRYSRPNVEQEDLVNEGIIGLIDAIKRFDKIKAKGNPKAFRNLAIVRIKSFMHEFFLNNSRNYKFPSYMARAVNLVGQMRALVENTTFDGDVEAVLLDFEPNGLEGCLPKDTVEKMRKVEERIITMAEGLDKSYKDLVSRVLEVERNIEDFESSQEDVDESVEEAIGNKEFLEKVLSNLNPVARTVLTDRLHGDTLDDVGEKLELTRERIRQIEAETLNYIRRTRIGQEASKG